MIGPGPKLAWAQVDAGRKWARGPSRHPCPSVCEGDQGSRRISCSGHLIEFTLVQVGSGIYRTCSRRIHRARMGSSCLTNLSSGNGQLLLYKLIKQGLAVLVI